MSRSSPYPSDLAKVVQAPIFHVNGDDPDAIVAVMKLAVDFQQIFKRDVVVDIVCYRRHGHNEGDEPMYTQPVMYKTITQHQTVSNIYKHKLIDLSILSDFELKTMQLAIQQVLNEEFDLGSSTTDDSDSLQIEPDWLKGRWGNIKSFQQTLLDKEDFISTGVNIAKLVLLIGQSFKVNKDFNLNAKLRKVIDQRLLMIQGQISVDWGMGEVLAFSSLLTEGYHVRLSGQDSRRGTFSHRHALWIDQENENSYVPLNHLQEGQGYFEVVDSPLAEASVLGFEYGYSLASPDNLVMWEAQFGDFANGAQVMIDQFVASSEAKWQRLSGLVLLLPHGYEGQGPEHSSARPERFLQMSSNNNWCIMNCSTPANLFHALRGQVINAHRMPLVIFTPKSLLRHKAATSKLVDFDEGSFLQKVIEDTFDTMKSARRYVFCTGKVYYDLFEKRESLNIKVLILKM